MSHLGVSHIVIRRQTHRRAVGFEFRVRIFRQKTVKIRGVGRLYGIAMAAVADPHAIHDHKYNRFLHSENSFSR